jgi:hypothetical protein
VVATMPAATMPNVLKALQKTMLAVKALQKTMLAVPRSRWTQSATTCHRHPPSDAPTTMNTIPIRAARPCASTHPTT